MAASSSRPKAAGPLPGTSPVASATGASASVSCREFKKNETVSLHITALTDRGEGVARLDDRVVFVKGAVPGDTVTAAFTKVKTHLAYARLLRVEIPSPDRISPRCPVAGRCGGCPLAMLRYEAQLRFKEDRVRNALTRIGGIANPPLLPIVGMDGEPYRYRNKTQLPVGRDRDGAIAFGFYAGRTHAIIPCEDCLLAPAENAAIVRAVRNWMEEEGIAPYDERTGEGLLRHLLIRKGFATGEILVSLIVNASGPEAFSEYAVNPRVHIATLTMNFNTRRDNVILGDRTEVVYGSPYIEDVLCGLRFRISTESFYQINHSQTEKLYQKIREFAALTGCERVWDLYCGIGTIGLYLAQEAKEVIGIEVVQRAVADARENAVRNSIQNATFYEGKAEELAPELWKKLQTARNAPADAEQTPGASAAEQPPDVVIVDPPRKGCDPKLLAAIASMQPDRLIYVSCDPATLARDLKILAGYGYEVECAQPFDLFAQTVHVETAVKLVSLPHPK